MSRLSNTNTTKALNALFIDLYNVRLLINFKQSIILISDLELPQALNQRRNFRTSDQFNVKRCIQI